MTASMIIAFAGLSLLLAMTPRPDTFRSEVPPWPADGIDRSMGRRSGWLADDCVHDHCVRRLELVVGDDTETRHLPIGSPALASRWNRPQHGPSIWLACR